MAIMTTTEEIKEVIKKDNLEELKLLLASCCLDIPAWLEFAITAKAPNCTLFLVECLDKQS